MSEKPWKVRGTFKFFPALYPLWEVPFRKCAFNTHSPLVESIMNSRGANRAHSKRFIKGRINSRYSNYSKSHLPDKSYLLTKWDIFMKVPGGNVIVDVMGRLNFKFLFLKLNWIYEMLLIQPSNQLFRSEFLYTVQICCIQINVEWHE